MKIEIMNIEDLVPSDILAAFTPGAVNEIVKDIADAARHEWIRIAGEELFTTRRDYLNGIQPVVFKDGTATIALVGQLPNLIEDGMDEIDLHDTLLGPKVPIAAGPGRFGKQISLDGGFHRAIPFRHGTPGTAGAVGQPMGRPYEGSDVVKDAKALGKKVYNKAKKLKATTSDPDKGTAYGGRLPAGIAPKLRPYHATDIYAGMIRERKTYVKATQSQYMTFRTIAVDSAGKPKGTSPWIRPATPGRHYAKQVSEFVQKIAPQAFEAYVEGLG